jgi:hypothetical protein
MLEARMKKSRLGNTILDVEDNGTMKPNNHMVYVLFSVREAVRYPLICPRS